MSQFEYTVIPAPARSEKVKGAKTPADRYAVALTEAINAMAAQGWEYVRAETLPSEERSGLTGRTTMFHNLLVFRRGLAQPVAAADRAVVSSAVQEGQAPSTLQAQAEAPEADPLAPRPAPEAAPPMPPAATRPPATLAAVTPDAVPAPQSDSAQPDETTPSAKPAPIFSRTMQMLGGVRRGETKE